ncbi:MAG: hypothetical protein KDD98_08440, partial [Sphingomonadaceae bacterium]|nr:hypothetical protein [Sphingomonadaceae bacterium]
SDKSPRAIAAPQKAALNQPIAILGIPTELLSTGPSIMAKRTFSAKASIQSASFPYFFASIAFL